MTPRQTSPGAPVALVRSFASLEAASAARDALIAAGLAREAIELSVREDEAGPVSGNFLVGNGVTTHGGPPGPVLAGPDVPYDENFRDPSYRGSYLLALTLDPAQQEAVMSVLARFDAVPVTEVADAGSQGGTS